MNKKLASAFAGSKTYHCKRGQLLVSPLEVSHAVYFIVTGYVKTYDIGFEGESQLIAMSGPSEIFPMFWALENENRHLFYEAMCDVEFTTMTRSDFRHVINSNLELMREQLDSVLLSFRSYRQRIQNLNLKTAEEKVAFQLFFLGENFGRHDEGYLYIDAPVTYQDLADSLNITRETVNRIISRFIKAGVVQKTDKRRYVCDTEKLSVLLNEESTLNA